MTDNLAFDKAALAWRSTITRSPPIPAVDGRLVLGCTVFGDVHVDRFLRFCVPSLLAPGNIEAVPDAVVVVHTDADHVETVIRGTGRLGPQVEVRAIPASVWLKTTHAERFALVNTASSMQMDDARAAGAGFHLLVPDHVYATGFFKNLMRLAAEGHQAIVGGGLSADVERIGRNLSRVKCVEAAVAADLKMLDDGYGDKVVIHDPTDVLEPPWVGAMFFDPDSNVFYQARGPNPADWRFVPPADLVGGFWKVYDFFVGAPPNDPQGPVAATRHLDAAKVRETMELNGVHVLDFGGLCWETVEGVKVYLVKIKFNRTRGFKLFAGFASERPNPAKPVTGEVGFHFENDLLTFNHEDRSVSAGEVLGFRIEVADGKARAFIDDVPFSSMIGEATDWPAVAMFEVADGPRPVVPGYEAAVNRHMNGAY